MGIWSKLRASLQRTQKPAGGATAPRRGQASRDVLGEHLQRSGDLLI